MKKKFKEKFDILTMVRKKIKEGVTTEYPEKIVEYVRELQNDYDISPELLAFILQKFNALFLNARMREGGGDQVNATIPVLDVREIAKQFGFDDIFKTLADRLESRTNQYRSSGTNRAKTAAKKYETLSKAASRDESLTDRFNKDHEMSDLKKLAQARALFDLENLRKKYWQHPNLETFIKAAGLDRLTRCKKVLDIIRENKLEITTKTANVSDFLSFDTDLRKLAELDDMVAKEGEDMDYQVGSQYKVIRRIKVGDEVVSAGTVLTIVDVVSDSEGNQTITVRTDKGNNYSIEEAKLSINTNKIEGVNDGSREVPAISNE